MPGVLPRALVLLALLFAGCGGSGGDAAGAEQTLLVADVPAGVRAPVVLALARGYDEAEGTRVQVRDDGDAYELLTTGRVDAAVVDVRALKPPLVAVLALVQGDQAGRPLRPGEPPRPGLVLAVTRDTLADRRAEVGALVAAVQRGMSEVASDPESAVTALLDADETLDRARTSAEVERAVPGYTAGAPAPGAIDPARLRAWSRWAGRQVGVDATLARPISRD